MIYDKIKTKKTIVLTESEKTAIICYILFPQYVWVAYGGINGLTENKVNPLIGHNVEKKVQIIVKNNKTIQSFGLV